MARDAAGREERGGPQRGADLSGARDRHVKDGGEVASGEIKRDEGHPQEMEGHEELQEEGPGVYSGVPQPRLQSSEARESIQEEVARPHDHSHKRRPESEVELGGES